MLMNTFMDTQSSLFEIRKSIPLKLGSEKEITARACEVMLIQIGSSHLREGLAANIVTTC